MRTFARARFIRLPSRKAKLILDQIRGKSVGEALSTLRFTPLVAARIVEKVLRSAIANAEHNHQVRNLDDLHVVQATADPGPSVKRIQPRAMGRAFSIRHRTSHVTVAVSDEVNLGARRSTTAVAASPTPAAKSERAGRRQRRAAEGAPAGRPSASESRAASRARPSRGATGGTRRRGPARSREKE